MEHNMIIQRTVVPKELLESCQLNTDVKIICSDGDCYSNRILLVYLSKFFRNLIRKHVEEYRGDEMVFIIPDVSQKHFQMMLDLAHEGQTFCESEAELEKFQNAVEYLQWRPNECLEVDYVQDEHAVQGTHYSSEDSGNSGSHESRSSLDTSSSDNRRRSSPRKRNRKNNCDENMQSDEEETGNESDQTVVLQRNGVKSKKAKNAQTTRTGMRTKRTPIIKIEKIEQPMNQYQDDDYIQDPFLEFSANRMQEPDTTQSRSVLQPIFETKIFESKLGFLNADVFNVSHDVVDISIFPGNPVNVVGRMKTSEALDFISQCRAVKEVITFRLAPKRNEGPDYEKYKTFFSYYVSKDRVCHLKCKNSPITHYYLIPLAKGTPVHNALLPFDGPALPEDRENCLLAVGLRQLNISSTSVTVRRHEREEILPNGIQRILGSSRSRVPRVAARKTYQTTYVREKRK